MELLAELPVWLVPGVLVVVVLSPSLVMALAGAWKTQRGMRRLGRELRWRFRWIDTRASALVNLPGSGAPSGGIAVQTVSGETSMRDTPAEAVIGRVAKSLSSALGLNESAFGGRFVACRLPFGRSPGVAIWARRPDTIVEETDVNGMERVEMEWAEFNDRFVVYASDRQLAYALLDAKVMGFLTRTLDARVTIGEGWVVSYTPGAPKESYEEVRRDCLARLAWMADFVAEWPLHLVEELSGSGAGIAGRV
jgi:hypothetical protein